LRIILLIAPSHPNKDSGFATFVTDYSGGTVPFTPQNNLKPHIFPDCMEVMV
jgi:hypothetical protein